MKKMMRLAIAVSTAAAVTFSATAAAPGLPVRADVVDSGGLAANILSLPERAPDLAPLSLDEAARDEVLAEIESDVTPQAGTLDDGQVEVYSVENAGTLALVPLVGEDLDVGSSVTAFFDEAGNISSVVELHFQLGADGGGSISAWQDDIRVTDVSLSAADVSEVLAEVGYRVSADVQGHPYIDKLSACLASKGVPQAMLALVGLLCGAACLVVAPCLVCLAALGAGIGTWVVACFNEVNGGRWG